MAAGDEQPPSRDDDKPPAPGKPDVRRSSHDDLGVHIDRDLRGEGSTARGWSSNMSQLNFSSRGRPRDEIVAPEAADPRAAPAAPAATPAAPAPGSPAASPAPAIGGVLSWFAGLISRR